MLSGIVLALLMVLVIPSLVMLTGAIWSVVFDALSVEDAERRAEGKPT